MSTALSPKQISLLRTALAGAMVLLGLTEIVLLWHSSLTPQSLGLAFLGFGKLLVALGLLGSSRLPYLGGVVLLSSTIMLEADWFRSDTSSALPALGLAGVLIAVLFYLLVTSRPAPLNRQKTKPSPE
ncbi:MAG: hypothetical protein O3B26_01710 [Proteobacteria bacterium]|jgi:hypothetical protein|nr:hypothetical protein [Pseudomonadota bacterium]